MMQLAVKYHHGLILLMYSYDHQYASYLVIQIIMYLVVLAYCPVASMVNNKELLMMKIALLVIRINRLVMVKWSFN